MCEKSKFYNLFDICEEANEDLKNLHAFLITLIRDKDGIESAYVNTCGGYSTLQDGEILLPLYGKSHRECWILKKEFEDKYLSDYIVKKINDTPAGESIRIPCDIAGDKKKQFDELYGIYWEDKNTDYIFEIRQTFDSSFQELSADDFSDLNKTHERLNKLEETLDVLYDNMKEIKEKRKRGYCLPEFYNIQCFGTGKTDARYGYLEDTRYLISKLCRFNLSKEMNYPLSDLRHRFDRMAELAACLGNRNRAILSCKWDLLFQVYSKRIAAKTFQDRLYPRFAFIGAECPMEIAEKTTAFDHIICEKYKDTHDFNEKSKTGKDFDIIFAEKQLKRQEKDPYIERILASECPSSIKKCVKDSCNLFSGWQDFLDLCFFDMSQTTDDKYSFLINNTVNWEWRTFANSSCSTAGCFHHPNYIPPPSKQNFRKIPCWLTPKDWWKTPRWMAEKNFCYDPQMITILTNLYYIYNCAQNEIKDNPGLEENIKKRVQYDFDFNFSIIARSIRVFCENVLLALYKIGRVPGLISYCSASSGTGKFWSGGKPYEYYMGRKGQDRIISAVLQPQDSVSNPINIYNDKKDPDHQLSCQKSILDLLKIANPEMHATGESPEFDAYADILGKIEDISKEVLGLLKKNVGVS